MQSNDEYTSYLNFVEEHYPFSSMVKANSENKFREIVTNSLKAIKILEVCNSHEQIHEDIKILTDDLKMYLLRLLYILPTNDYFFVDTLLSSISENLLRIAYKIAFPTESVESIKKLNHKKIWKEGIKTNAIYKDHNEILTGINRIFGDKSSTVHSTQKDYDNQVDYLINLMRKETKMSLRKLNSDIKVVYNFLSHDLLSLLHINETNLTLQQSIVLKKVTKQGRLKGLIR